MNRQIFGKTGLHHNREDRHDTLIFRARFELLSQDAKGESNMPLHFAAIVNSVKLLLKLKFSALKINHA